jgi:ankyrin repeat protein
MLLAKRADVGARNNNDVTPLYLASYGDNAVIVKLLLAAGANVNAKSLGGWTPLHAAAEKDRGEIAEILLANHAEIGAQIDGGNTPLNIGVANGSKAVVKLLLARGADVNVSAIGDHGWTVLQLAVRDGHLDLVELLIANHADVNAENEYGWTPLHYAAEKGNLRIAQLLIANGADVSASSAVPNWNDNKSQEWKRQARKNGKKPLYFATCGGHKDVAELFRQPDRISEKEDVKGAYSLGGPGPNGGIVFDLDDLGLHGLEANREDSHNAIREGGVMWCDAVDALARTGGGRLPTVQELQLLFSRKGLVGGFENGHYWTSERCPGSEYLGWAVVFPWGNESKLRAYHDSRRGIDAAYVRGIHNFERSATTLEPSSEHEIDQIPATLGLPKMANPGLVQKLTRSDLPEMIYIPAITIGSMGYSYAQYPDDEGRTHVPVFASEPRATQWLALGKELWIERRDPREGFTTRQFHIRREESTVFDSGLYKRYLLDFEPAPGDLFAPKERTIEILIAENIQ